MGPKNAHLLSHRNSLAKSDTKQWGALFSLGLRPEAVLTQSTRLRCSRSGNASSRCLSRLGSKLATARPITSSSITLSACQKPFHGKSWRQMPLMLLGKVCNDLALPQHEIYNFEQREAFHKPLRMVSKLRDRAVAWTCSAFFEGFAFHFWHDSSTEVPLLTEQSVV